MKYINIKRYKFSTILKNIYTLIVKSLNTLIIKNFKILSNKALKLFEYIDFKQYDFRKIYKYFYIKRYINLQRKIKFTSSKFLILHLPASIFLFGFLYLAIPTFYNYDKSNIEKVICKNNNIECSIMGGVNYSFYPTPRIKIKDIIINDFFEKKKTLIKVESAVIKLSIKNLLAKEKHQFKKIKLINYEINFNLKNLWKYENIFTKNIFPFPIVFANGKVIFFDGKDYVATVNDANIDLKFVKDSIDTILKGKFLEDNIYVNLESKKIDNLLTTNIILKMSNMNFLTKINFINSKKGKNIISGNFLIKKGKNRITAIFDYKDNVLIINKSNLTNTFLDGQLKGKIILLPYFDFNLDLDLNSINFTRLYNYFLYLDENSQKSLFKINNKINGQLNLSSDKIYSSYNLVKSLESRLKFYNGNISIEQFLLNLGKLGAADILGTISYDKKFTNFKFESNIFLDNQRKFLSKFGIYNKKEIPPNLFVSGNFDLKNIKTSFYEISNDNKFNNEDINYIEKEFNDFMLSEGYANLFNFKKFKEFIKSIVSENN